MEYPRADPGASSPAVVGSGQSPKMWDEVQHLFDPMRFNGCTFIRGYVDLVGEVGLPSQRIVQKLMRSKAYVTIYQVGRQAFRSVAKMYAPSRPDDRTRIAEGLNLSPGKVVVDIGCGPGNFTRIYGLAVSPDGVAIGVDASDQMLSRATAQRSTRALYVRGDAMRLPLRDEVADSASCLAALYLIEHPFEALSEMVRVLTPGGRLVVLTTRAPGGSTATLRSRALGAVSGCRMFGHEEITGYLRSTGCDVVEHLYGGWSQTVVAIKRPR